VRARARLRAEGPQGNGREPAHDCPVADRTYAARMHVRLHGHHTPRNVHGRFCVIYDGALFVSLVGHLIFGCRAPVAHAHRDRKVRSDCATAFPLAAYIDRVPVSRGVTSRDGSGALVNRSARCSAKCIVVGLRPSY